ncbi:MAG: hypothetical protein ACQSGP_21930 [Frankia sp.]
MLVTTVDLIGSVADLARTSCSPQIENSAFVPKLNSEGDTVSGFSRPSQ